MQQIRLFCGSFSLKFCACLGVRISKHRQNYLFSVISQLCEALRSTKLEFYAPKFFGLFAYSQTYEQINQKILERSARYAIEKSSRLELVLSQKTRPKK